MFKPKTPAEPTSLDLAIDKLFTHMSAEYGDTDSYSKLADQLVKLQTLKDASRPDRLSADAKATIAANLAGILLILNHERAGIVTSKALSFIQKLR
jgi:hypothetical protein